MEISRCMQMDTNILLGIVNDRLRHECQGLKNLAAMLDVEQQQLENKFAESGFHYEAGQNQFRPDHK